MVSCVYPVATGLVVRTRSEKIDRIRKMILELQLAHAPDAFELKDLAKEYGANPNRFEKEASFCIHCGLCVRYCAEVKGKHAGGLHRPRHAQGDQLHSRDRGQGVLELQGMLPAVPDRSAPGPLTVLTESLFSANPPFQE